MIETNIVSINDFETKFKEVEGFMLNFTRQFIFTGTVNYQLGTQFSFIMTT